MGKCKGVPSSGGGAGKLLNGLPWEYTTFDEEPIKPLKTVGCKGYMEAFGDCTSQVIPEITDSIYGLSYEWISDDTLALLYSVSTSVYLVIDKFDAEHNRFITMSKTLVKTLDENYLNTSKILKTSDNTLTLLTSKYSNSNSGSNKDKWEVNYIKVTLNDFIVTIDSSGYIDSGIGAGNFPVLCDALYDANTDRYVIAYLYGAYCYLSLVTVDNSTMTKIKIYDGLDILYGSHSLYGTDQPTTQVRIKMMGSYIIVLCFTYYSSYSGCILDINLNIKYRISSFFKTNSNDYIIEYRIDIRILSENNAIAVFWFSNVMYVLSITENNGAFSTTYVSKSNSFVSIGYSGMHTEAALLPIDNTNTMAFFAGNAGSETYGAAGYALIEHSSEGITIGDVKKISYWNKNQQPSLIARKGVGDFFFRIKNVNYSQYNYMHYKIKDSKIMYANFNTMQIEQPTSGDVYAVSCWLTDDRVVVAYRNSSGATTIKMNNVVNNRLVNVSTMSTGLSGYPIFITALNDTDILFGTSAKTYLLRVSSDNTVSIITTCTTNGVGKQIMTMLNPKLLIAFQYDSAFYAIIIGDDDSITYKSLGISTKYATQSEAYRLSDNSFIITGYDINTMIITINSDYTISTVELNYLNNYYMARLSERQFLFLNRTLSTANLSAGAYLATINESLTGMETESKLSMNVACKSLVPYPMKPLFNRGTSVFNDFRGNYSPLSSMIMAANSTTAERYHYIYMIHPNVSVDILADLTGLPYQAVIHMCNNSKDDYLFMYTLPDDDTLYYHIGKIYDVLQDNNGVSHLATSKISKGKFSKSYATGGVENDKYPY